LQKRALRVGGTFQRQFFTDLSHTRSGHTYRRKKYMMELSDGHPGADILVVSAKI
jgi:hypothetical protein